MSGGRGFFEIDERYAALSAAGDPLQRLASVVDFEVFRPGLDAALARSNWSKGGRANVGGNPVRARSSDCGLPTLLHAQRNSSSRHRFVMRRRHSPHYGAWRRHARLHHRCRVARRRCRGRGHLAHHGISCGSRCGCYWRVGSMAAPSSRFPDELVTPMPCSPTRIGTWHPTYQADYGPAATSRAPGGSTSNELRG